MKKNKGISLIVLVITIIIMIILAGAIILSLQSSGIIERAQDAVEKSNKATIRQTATIISSELELELLNNPNFLNGKSKKQYIKEKLEEQGFDLSKITITEIDGGQIIVAEVEIKEVFETSENKYVLLNNGTVLAAGLNDKGQLGLGDFNSRNTFVQIPVETLSNVKTLFCREKSAYAILEDGTVKSWGGNSNGRLGLGHANDVATPTQIDNNKLSNVKEITTFAGSHMYAIINDGTVRVWGSSLYGRLGIPESGDILEPVQVPINSLSNVKQIKMGNGAMYAVLYDGTVKSWGNNAYGALGLGDTERRDTPVQIPGLLNVKEVYSSSMYNCAYALLNDGTMKAWGNNESGQLGIGNTSTQYTPQQIPISKLSNVKEFELIQKHAYALTNDNKFIVWGDNNYRQLGAGNVSIQTQPVQVLEGVKNFPIVTSTYIVALMNDGTVKTCGTNTHGTLGLGDTNQRNTFTLIPTDKLSDVKQIEMGSFSIYALLSNGTVKTWGNNSSGQLGLGDTQNRLSPTEIPVSKLSSVKNIWSNGYNTVIAEQENGDIKVWGSNYNNKLGVGGIQNRTEPTKIRY
ncbi:MAG: hypothetical protein PHD20_03550 [Clostridia bacterium]|nr:hypothetical protein [Clostridia bacterium]